MHYPTEEVEKSWNIETLVLVLGHCVSIILSYQQFVWESIEKAWVTIRVEVSETSGNLILTGDWPIFAYTLVMTLSSINHIVGVIFIYFADGYDTVLCSTFCSCEYGYLAETFGDESTYSMKMSHGLINSDFVVDYTLASLQCLLTNVAKWSLL